MGPGPTRPDPQIVRVLKQPGDLARLVQPDPLGGGVAGQARHRHHVAAEIATTKPAPADRRTSRTGRV